MMFPNTASVLDVYFLLCVFVFGAIIGSFLNVVIYRLHTKRSLKGSSHCLSCGHQLSWYELFPLVSYIALRGKCRVCHSYIPARYFLVELLTAFGFIAIYVQGGPIIMMMLIALLFALLVIISVYDVYHFIIPNELVLYVSAVAVFIYGHAFYVGLSLTSFISHCIAGLGASLFFGMLWKVSKGRWIGFGDVKLALPLGVLAGLPGAFSMVVLSFWVGASVSIVIMGIPRVVAYWNQFVDFVVGRTLVAAKKTRYRNLQSFYSNLVVAKNQRYFTMKSEVPFAPFLVAGFILSYFYSVDVLSLINYVFPV